MAFNTVGIQDNLPVLPVHVLQIIQSLTFTGTYSAENFFREGRTNFGAAAFTSSAHVEMHSLGGVDPLVVYSGPFNDTEVFSIDVNGATTATSLTASNATITALAVANEAVINSAITAATITTASIQTATVTGLTAQNAVITTLNGTVGAIATFTASNASVTNTISASNLYAGALTSPSATITTGNITTGVINNLTTSTGSIGLLSTTNATVANNLGVTNNVAVSNNLSVTGSTAIVGNLNVGGTITSSQVTIDYTNTDSINAAGNNSHIKLNNPSATGQTAISYIIDGKLTGKLRSDYVGGMNYISSGSGNHYFFTQGDYPGGNVRLMVSSSGNVGIGTSSPTTKLEVVGTTKATQFEGPLQGTASWALNVVSGGIAGNPAGVAGQVQYNNAGLFGAIPNLTYLNGVLTATGSFTGSLVGTATTASFAPITAGPGITVNGMQVTASVRTVNGISPTNGNIAVSLAGVLTGLSSSNYNVNLAASSSGTITGSFSNGALWVVSGETGSVTSGSNGQVFIFKSGSVGEWLRVAPLDTAAADARYLQLAGGTMASAINMGGFNATNAGTWQGTAYTASFVTASNVYGPYGASSVVSSSYALSSSFATSASYALSSSFATSASYALSSSFAVSASWAPVQTVSTASFITTGSISTTQTITGSLTVTGSGLTVTGSLSIRNGTLTTNQSIIVDAGAGGIGASYIFPYGGIDFVNTTYYPGFAHFRPSNTGQSQLNAGGVYYIWADVNIGPQVSGVKAGSIKIATDTGNTSPTATTTYTLVSHGNNVTDNNTTWKTANGRDHALTVSGSMLARDGVSLGTNIANSHIITGSVNMTGSFTLNGTNLSTLVSPILSTTVDLTQNQILTLGTTPVVVVPAPAIGKYVSVVQTTLYYKANTSPYIANTAVVVLNGNFVLNSNTLLANTSDTIVIAPGTTSSQISSNSQFGYPASAFLNQPVTVTAPNGINPSGGDGTMRVRVLYTIEDAL